MGNWAQGHPKNDETRAQKNNEKLLEKRGCELCKGCSQTEYGGVGGFPIQSCSAGQQYKLTQANRPEQTDQG